VRIRKNQMNAFAEAATTDFENRMVAHLNRCFPAQCVSLQEPRVRETIRFGIERCAHYGVTAERDVCRYIDLMMVFGRDFDAREDLPWVSRILNDGVLKTPTARIERLFSVAKVEQAR
jgi:hypothetical protein